MISYLLLFMSILRILPVSQMKERRYSTISVSSVKIHGVCFTLRKKKASSHIINARPSFIIQMCSHDTWFQQESPSHCLSVSLPCTWPSGPWVSKPHSSQHPSRTHLFPLNYSSPFCLFQKRILPTIISYLFSVSSLLFNHVKLLLPTRKFSMDTVSKR